MGRYECEEEGKTKAPFEHQAAVWTDLKQAQTYSTAVGHLVAPAGLVHTPSEDRRHQKNRKEREAVYDRYLLEVFHKASCPADF